MKEVKDLLEKAYDEFKLDNNESLMVLYLTDEGDILTYNGGSISDRAKMIEWVLNEGLKKGADEALAVHALSIVKGVKDMISTPSIQSVILAKEILEGMGKTIDSFKKAHKSENCDDCDIRMTCMEKPAVKWRKKNGIPEGQSGAN